MVKLTTLDIFCGIITIIAILVVLILVSIMFYKYTRIRNKNLLFMGLCLLCVSTLWWGSALSFLMIITTGNGLNFVEYFFIHLVFAVWALFFWIMVFSDLLVQPKNKKEIRLVFLIFSILSEIIILSLLFTNHSIYGSVEGINASYGILM